MEFGDAAKILSTFGPCGLIVLVLVYLVLRGEIEFRYPRNNNRRNR